ncbi:MAG: NUDIX hydrolase [Verrucomicrobia bacterium]|nr:NUDIX hydrolase [Verrucomicrobiota bacterium]
MIRSWTTVASAPQADYGVFRVRVERRRSPRTGAEHGFVVLDCADWVNVVAVTPARELVMIEQFRHGTETVELEIPGGVVDPKDASPVAAGLRELREETGYEGEGARVLGRIAPNPAIMGNRCSTVLVERCVLRHPLQFDHSEDLVTRLVPVAEVPGLIATGRIQHALVVVALCLFDLAQRVSPGPSASGRS